MIISILERKLRISFILTVLLFSSFLESLAFGQKQNTNFQSIRIVGEVLQLPFSAITPKGDVEGYLIDITNVIMRNIDENFVYNLYSLEDVLMSLKNGNADLAIGILETKTTLKDFKFSEPFFYIYPQMVMRRGSNIKEIKDLKNKCVAYVAASPMIDVIDDEIPYQKCPVSSIEEGFKLLKSGGCDILLASRTLSGYFLTKPEYSSLTRRQIDTLPIKCCFAILKNGDENLLNKVNNALAEIKRNGEFDKITSLWFYKDSQSFNKYLLLIIFIISILALLAFLFVYLLRKKVLEASRSLNSLIDERNWIINELQDNKNMLTLALGAGKLSVWSFNPKSKTFSNVYGNLFPKENWTIDDSFNNVHSDDFNIYKAALTRLINGESNMESLTIRFKSFKTYKFEYTHQDIVAEYSLTGELSKLIGMRKDINAEIVNSQKLDIASKKLADSSELHNAILNSIPIQFFAKDPKDSFKYVFSNDSHNKFVGLTNSDVVGKDDFEIYKSEAHQLRGHDELVMLNNIPCEFVETLHSASGNMRILKTFKRPFTRSNGQKLLFGACIDLTDASLLLKNATITNSCLNHLTLEDNFNENLKFFINQIKDSDQSDRIIIAKFNENGLLREYLSWNRQTGKFATPENIVAYQNLWDENMELLQTNDIIEFPDFKKSPLAEKLVDFNAKSLAVIPIRINNVLWGAVFIAQVRFHKKYDAISSRIMKSLANMISIAWQKKLRIEQNKAVEKEQELILDNVNAPIILFDNTLKILRVNNAIAELLKKTKDSFVNKDYYDFVDETIGRKNNIGEKILATKTSISRKISYAQRDFISTVVPVLDSNKKILRYIVSLFDVTQIKKALKKAMEADNAKSYFLASMSHEIRTPLNAVIGFSDVLKRGALTEAEINEYANNISVAGNALLDLINDILDLSKLESGNMQIFPTMINFTSITSELVSIFKQRLKLKGLEGILEIDDMPSIYIDKQRVRQILFNLMSNAIKFTNKGWVKLTASFEKIDDKKGNFKFSVSDSGLGISDNDQKLLFKAFVQADSMRGTHAQNQGTGLGLVICKQLVEKMNGTITLESELGKGSIFTVSINDIPYTQSDSSNYKVIEAEPKLITSAKVLIVDDVLMNLSLMKVLLKGAGANVLATNISEDALKIFRENDDIDIVLTDLWMPKMSGSDLAKAMRKIRPNAKIFAVTADIDSQQNFDMKYFDAILIKPITVKQLKEKVFN